MSDLDTTTNPPGWSVAREDVTWTEEDGHAAGRAMDMTAAALGHMRHAEFCGDSLPADPQGIVDLLAGARAELDEVLARVATVPAIDGLRGDHRPVELEPECPNCGEGFCGGHETVIVCYGCDEDWPCATGALIAAHDAMVVGAHHGRAWLDEMRAERDRLRAALEAARTALGSAESGWEDDPHRAAYRARLDIELALKPSDPQVLAAIARADALRAEADA